MIYDLHDLLIKMGAPEVREKGRMEWHYFNPEKNELAGFAEIRLEAGGRRLIAELKHVRENYEDDTGKVHPTYTDSFHLLAERTAKPARYRVTEIAFDGDSYDKPSKPVIELGLSLFHARALDISLCMVEQAFNKQDITDPVIDPQSQFKAFRMRKEPPRRENTGVVIPFRPRSRLTAGRRDFRI